MTGAGEAGKAGLVDEEDEEEDDEDGDKNGADDETGAGESRKEDSESLMKLREKYATTETPKSIETKREQDEYKRKAVEQKEHENKAR